MNRWRFPSTYWFPLATIYSALILPWSVLGQLGHLPAPPGATDPLGHAHEMLFGFALAAVAGYTLTPGTNRRSMTLVGAWLLARVASLWWPTSWAAGAFNALFAFGLAASVAPLYWRANKWRNRSVAFILVGLVTAVIAFHAGALTRNTSISSTILLEAVLILSALMFFMGGRILAPAIAGHIRRKGPKLEHVVQDQLEGSTLALLATVALCLMARHEVLRHIAALLLFISAAFALARVGRWRIWFCRDEPDLLALLAGYTWLTIGWILAGRALLLGISPAPALHAITIGALGTLSWNIMLRTALFRARCGTNALPWARVAVLAIAAAAILRIVAQGEMLQWALPLAAAIWCVCYCTLFALLVLTIRWTGLPSVLRGPIE